MRDSPESPRGYCDRCKRPGFLGRLLYMGNGQWTCIDCFSFLTGTDDRDPVTDHSAVSGIERRPIVEVGETGSDYVPAGADDGTRPCPTGAHREGGLLGVCGCERPIGDPLPKDSPWWARLLHWIGLRATTMR